MDWHIKFQTCRYSSRKVIPMTRTATVQQKQQITEQSIIVTTKKTGFCHQAHVDSLS